MWVREIYVKAMNIAAGTDTTPTMKNETKSNILKSTLSEYQYVITKKKQNNNNKKEKRKKSIHI